MKLAAIYVYKRTSDKGRELRYSIRSLHNVSNWNGEIFVAGDREDWFSDRIKIIEAEKSADRYEDCRNKLRAVVNSRHVPATFLFFNDDFYVLKKAAVQPLYDGELESATSTNAWIQSKSDTKDYLENRSMLKPLNYDIHTPLIFDKQKLAVSLEICQENPELQLRSIYGNMHRIGGKQYKDCKTRTDKLPEGKFVSTHLFVPELEALFPDKSEFEK